MRIRLLLALSLAFIVLVGGGCAAIPQSASSSFDRKLNTVVQPYTFSLAGWQISTTLNEIQQRITSPQPNVALNSQAVVNYFSYMTQLQGLKSDLQMVQAKKVQGNIDLYESKITEVNTQISALKPIVERTIARQIGEVLVDQGIFNPFGNRWFNLVFPAVNFKLEKPLYEVIISPREKIQRDQSITIKPDINTAQMEEIENSVENLNKSAVVVQIGGLGATYPTFVVNNADLRWTIDTAAHEWLHQYLAFKPVGFRYVLDLLGISKNYEIGTINETTASIIGQELGALVYKKYYPQYHVGNSPSEKRPVAEGFDFNATMRTVRKTVDEYLKQGQVDEAEKYMENQRQILATKGYYIRKLNQAYFAFYGTYADGPTSVDPIGGNLRQLRAHSPTIKDFLDQVSGLTSSQDLSQMVSQFK